MEYENHRRLQRGILLLVFAGVSVISLILFPINESAKKVAAARIMRTPNNIMKINKTSLNNPGGYNGLIVNKNPIYQAS
jgi:hypothetical protein